MYDSQFIQQDIGFMRFVHYYAVFKMILNEVCMPVTSYYIQNSTELVDIRE